MKAGRWRPRYWFLIAAAWFVPAVLSAFNTYAQGRLNGRSTDWRWVLFGAGDWLLYALLTPAVFSASRRFPLQRPHLGRNIGFHAFGAFIMCVAWAGLGTVLRLALFAPGSNGVARDIGIGFISWLFTTLPFGYGVYFALVGIEHSFYYFAQARERETQAARLAAQLSEAQLSALRMQLNPHFLFNSLNAITVLVRDGNASDASRVLELLSDVLRQVLQSDAAHETTLARELAFLEQYLAIEQVRFSDRLRSSIDVSPELRTALVPKFLLQPLVENALHHGIARLSEAGLLEVAARREGNDLVLTVRDDGPGVKAEVGPEGGVGLSNTLARLEALYGSSGKLDLANASGGGAIATVRLPYHEAKANG